LRGEAHLVEVSLLVEEKRIPWEMEGTWQGRILSIVELLLE
jgi:hypothetical protein